MTHSRWPGLVFCSLAVVLVLSVDSGKSQDKPPSSTTLRVLVPHKRARILIDGKKTAARPGRTREVVAPPLAAGK